jgi:tRNA pseudouridine38-40 synthase
MPRYKLTIEYDGTGFSGWQRQHDYPSIQQELEEAIERYCGSLCPLTCAGRTDAGVHAYGQVAHVDLPMARKPFSIQQGVNFHLASPQIAITKVEEVSDEFHARFDAVQRDYFYLIINRSARLVLENNRAWHIPEPLDADAMHRAAQLLVGHHNFNSFRDSDCQSKTPLKTLDCCDVVRSGEEIRLYFSAKSFLHHQVRILTGTLRLIGNGKWNERNIRHALAAETRSAAGETAPATGLYFMQVGY